MQFNELDVVSINVNYEVNGITKGDIGTIIATFSIPNEAYDVEFIDENGGTKAILTLLPHELSKA